MRVTPFKQNVLLFFAGAFPLKKCSVLFTESHAEEAHVLHCGTATQRPLQADAREPKEQVSWPHGNEAAITELHRVRKLLMCVTSFTLTMTYEKSLSLPRKKWRPRELGQLSKAGGR